MELRLFRVFMVLMIFLSLCATVGCITYATVNWQDNQFKLRLACVQGGGVYDSYRDNCIWSRSSGPVQQP